MQSSTLYSSAKFVPIGSPQRVGTGRRNCILWIIVIIIITVIILCSSSVLYCLKKYTGDNYVTDNRTYNKSAVKNFNEIPQIWLNINYKIPEGNCQQSHQLQAVPPNLLDQLNDSKVHDIMNKVLLLHVENLIEKHSPQLLKTIFNVYNRKLSSMDKFDEFVIFLRNLNSNRIRFCLRFLKTSARLTDFKTFFVLVEELSTWYNYLHNLGNFLSAYEEQKRREFYVNVTDVNFYKFTTETQTKVLGTVYSFNLTKKKIWEVNDVIREWLSPVQVEVRNGSCIFSNNVVVLSEVIKKVPGDIHTVKVLCGYALYLDVDLTLPGINLGMVAPKWIFLRRVKIDLDGLEGNMHEENDKGTGKPGNPGSNAGDFLGVGDVKEDYLVVSTNGGKGGPGQNGAKGFDGADYTRPDPPFHKPGCVSRINAFRNQYNQTITRYRIFGGSGCGGSGSDGGVGGLGGKSGIVILVNKSVKIIKGTNGERGSPGKGGPGGSGGKDGCFYEVFDVNDEVLHRVTNVKCTPGNNLPSGNPGKDNLNKKGITEPRVKSNLSVCDCIVDFLQKTKLNPEIISTLMKLNIYNVECVIKQYNAYKMHSSIELYNVLKNSKFKFLNSILLLRILILKDNIDFLFIDYDDYLNVIEMSIKNTNEQTQELPPISYLKRKIVTKVDRFTQILKTIKSKLLNLDESGGFEEDEKITCVMLATIDVMLSLAKKTSVAKIKVLNGLLRKCLTPVVYIDTDTEIILPQNEKFEVLMIDAGDVELYLEKLKDALNYLKDLLKLKAEKRKLLQELVNEVKHLALLSRFTEWEKSVDSIFQSMKATKVKLLKGELIDALIMLQYKMAEDAARQKQYPFIKQDIHPMSENRMTLVDLLDRLKILRESPTNDCRSELQAYFGKNSAVGEFYFWPNSDVRMEVEELFSGAEVRLESLKLEFETSDERRGRLLQNILLNYKMTMTHSGYSHYNWMGETRVVVSEEVTFEYSFKTRVNGEPEVYNVLYKKVQNGDIALSPYTTWTIRLSAINEKADYLDLKPYNDLVSLRLTGTGTFIP